MLHIYIDFLGAFAYTQQLLALSCLSVCPPFCLQDRTTLTRRVFVNLLFGIFTIICQKAS